MQLLLQKKVFTHLDKNHIVDFLNVPKNNINLFEARKKFIFCLNAIGENHKKTQKLKSIFIQQIKERIKNSNKISIFSDENIHGWGKSERNKIF